jgi:hypothetical protein
MMRSPSAGSAHQQADLDFRDDPLSQGGAAIGRVGAHLDRDVKGRIAELVGIAEQRLGAQDVLACRGLRQADGDLRQRIAHVFDSGGAQSHRQLGKEAPRRHDAQDEGANHQWRRVPHG